MIKILKHLKPFVLSILLVIVLLVIQSQADLALPSYMSDIVNVGIQQSGFENGEVEILTNDEYEKISLILTEEELEKFRNDYVLETESSYKEVYKNLSDDFYIYMGEGETSYLDEAIMTILYLEENKASICETYGLDLNTDLYAILDMANIRKTVSLEIQKLGDLKDTIILQTRITYAKSLYENLGRDISKIQTKYILKIGLIMILVSLLGAAASISVGFLASKIASGLGKNLREKMFSKITYFSNKEYDDFGIASLITRSTNDINQIQNLLVIVIRMVFFAPLLGVGGIFKIMETNASMMWVIILALSCIIFFIILLILFALPKFKKVQGLVDKLNSRMREKLNGILVIRAFNNEKFQEKRFDEVNKDLTKTNLFINRFISLLFPFMMFVMNGATLLIVWVGSHEIASANMMVGDMIAFMQYGMQIIMSFLMLSTMFILIPRALVSLKRINEVLDIDPKIKDSLNIKKIKNPKGVIEFKNVSFRYEGAEEDMLKGLSFKAEPGKVTAIIGSTGSGKTTVLNLIPRFYDVTYGEILIDNTDIRDLKQKDLRKLIGYVPQQSILFKGTIKSNIKFSNEKLSENKIKEAVKVAQAKNIVKEKGLDSNIAQKGQNVSGGQRQRLAIARTIAKNPLIYLFDDSFSALDYRTDKELRKALMKKTKDKTVLIIAQRVSTIKNADQIIVLEDGNIVGTGKHTDLLKNCKTYQEIAYSQLSKEELK